MFSQFFILSDRGYTLIFRDYRSDLVKGIPEIFFRKVKSFAKGDTIPFFDVEGIHFIHVSRNSLYFAFATRFDCAPMFAVELLHRIADVCKDFCGALNEEAVIANFPLIYEVLDEFLDYGYPQVTSTDHLKSFVFNQAKTPKKNSAQESIWNPTGANVFGNETLSVPGSASSKSILDKKSNKNEVFVDIFENLSVCFDEQGDVVLNQINGSLQLKSFLAGTPEIRMSFKEDGPSILQTPGVWLGIPLDSIKFHECVNLNEFDNSQMLIFTPPHGEFVAMRYGLNAEHQNVSPPFVINCHAEEMTDGRELKLTLQISCNISTSSTANDVMLELPLPSETISVSCESQRASRLPEFKPHRKCVFWELGKFPGGANVQAEIKIKIPPGCKSAKSETGPLSMYFELPMFVSSKLRIKSLKVFEKSSLYTPSRWIRYITHSESYIRRIKFS